MIHAAFTSNPEFKRNLWLSFSTHRLIAMPALLGLFLLAIALHNPEKTVSNLYQSAITFFIFIVWLWGARNANATIVDELRDKTWDQQRMSALGPWAMTWGKLFGATAFNWYGGVICLLVMMFSGIADEQPYWLTDLLSLTFAGILLHAALIALNLHTSQLEMRLIQRGGIGWIAIIFALIALRSVVTGLITNSDSVTWWNAEIESRQFLLGSLLLFAACAVFAAWRVMSNALQVRTLPWAWPSFALILAVYFTGLFHSDGDTPLYMLGHVGLYIALLMSYITLFTEPNTQLNWNRLRLRQQTGDWRGWLEHLPLWPTTLLLAFCFALLATLSQSFWMAHSKLPDIFSLPFSLALMLLRDAAILLFFSFSAKTRQPAALAILSLVVINLVLPLYCRIGGLDLLSYFFMPLDDKYGAVASLMVMLTHVAIALGLVAWRLGKSRQP